MLLNRCIYKLRVKCGRRGRRFRAPGDNDEYIAEDPRSNVNAGTNRPRFVLHIVMVRVLAAVFLLAVFLAILSLIFLLLFYAPRFTFTFVAYLLLYVFYSFGDETTVQLLTKSCSTELKYSFFWGALLEILRRSMWMRTKAPQEDFNIVLFVLIFGMILVIPSDSPMNTVEIPYVPYPVLLSGTLCLLVFCSVKLLSSRIHETHLRAGDRLRRQEEYATEEARMKNKKISKILAEFHSYGNIDWFASFFLRKAGITEKEAEIQSIFEYPNTDTYTLNCLVTECKLETLFEKIRDRQERKSRSLLIDLLCIERLDELEVRSRALIINAIMVNRLSCSSVAEEGVKNIILKTQGDELSILKSMTDAKGSVHSFYKLVFLDMSRASRTEILAHVMRESTTQVALRCLAENRQFQSLIAMQKNQPHAKELPIELDFLTHSPAHLKPYDGIRTKHQWKKILTDMDDTLLCSGGWYPAGIDLRYPRNTAYPGVTTFFHTMEEKLVDSKRQWDWWKYPSTLANCVHIKLPKPHYTDQAHLVGLSARPHVPGNMMEERVFTEFERLQKDHGLKSMPTLLTGGLDTSAAFMFTGEAEYLGRKKFETFQEYFSLYPEFLFIFVGDNGQADLVCAIKMLHKYEQVIDQIYIHLVQDADRAAGYHDYLALPQNLQDKIYMYTDYVDAAIHAATKPHQLISLEALWRVGYAAVNDFEGIARFLSVGPKRIAGGQLNKSIMRANQVLYGARVKLPAIRTLDLEQDEPEDEVLSSVGSVMGKRRLSFTGHQKTKDIEIQTTAPCDTGNVRMSQLANQEMEENLSSSKNSIYSLQNKASLFLQELKQDLSTLSASMEKIDEVARPTLRSTLRPISELNPAAFESCTDLAGMDTEPTPEFREFKSTASSHSLTNK